MQENRANIKMCALLISAWFLSVFPPYINIAQEQDTAKPTVIIEPDIQTELEVVKEERRLKDERNSEELKALTKETKALNLIVARKEIKANDKQILGLVNGELLPIDTEHYADYLIVNIDSICALKDTVYITEIIQPEPDTVIIEKKGLFKKIQSLFKK